MGNIVGIDLGTTFSAVAHLDETGRPLIVHNKDGDNLTSSVVEFVDDNRAEVSETARGNMYLLDFQGAARFKREMGTSTTYEIRGKSYSPTDMSAFVLRKLKDDTEAQIGPIDTAVVTIPANFANAARDATLAAAQSVGLNVETIINEPEAAALFYALDKGNLAGTYAVFDLGGGTFDFSVVRVHGYDVEVLGSNGVNRLGGDDFDKKLLGVIGDKYKQQTGNTLEDALFDRNRAEEVKIHLSKRDSHKIQIGKDVVEVSRAEFEESISGHLAQAKMACEGLMKEELKIDFSKLTDVFLVGGSTRIPAVQSMINKMIGKDPVSTANVDEVVAKGAAFYAAYKSPAHNLTPLQKQKVDPVTLQLVTHKFFGTITSNREGEDQNSILINKGADYPCSVTEDFYTLSDGQTGVNIRITETSEKSTDPTWATILKEGYLKVPGGRPAGQQIDVTFELKDDQILRAEYKDVASGENIMIEINLTDAGGSKLEDPTKVFTVE